MSPFFHARNPMVFANVARWCGTLTATARRF
jgi:hypothetical protein